MGNILFLLVFTPPPPPNVQQEQKLSSCLALIAQKKKKPRVWTAARGRKTTTGQSFSIFIFATLLPGLASVLMAAIQMSHGAFFPASIKDKKGGGGVVFLLEVW